MSSQTKVVPPRTKEWTIRFYFASDNPLAPSVVSQLKAIKDAGYHPEANVVAQFDPHTAGTQMHIFDVNLVNKLKDDGQPRSGFPSSDPYIRSLVLDKLWKKGEVRQGIKNSLNNGNGRERTEVAYEPPEPTEEMSVEQSPRRSLSNFLKFCRDHYPARHYMLFILGHGLVVGNDLFLYDENTPQGTPAPTGNSEGAWRRKSPAGEDKDSARQNYLLLKELGEVLRVFKEGRKDEEGNVIESGIGEGNEFELVAFHSCSMSSLEVAYELKGTANYMLASQGPAFVGSWPYRQILLRVFNDLSVGLKRSDLKDAAGLVKALKEKKAGSVAEFLHGRLGEDAKMARLLAEHDGTRPPGEELFSALLKGLNKCVSDPKLCEDQVFNALGLSGDGGRLKKSKKKLRRAGVTRLNRLLLAEAYPLAVADIPRVDVKRMLRKIFDYCLYYSHDFQLAGYSFDLALCDLRRVPDVTDPLKGLSAALTAALPAKPNEPGEDQLAMSLILLAHWDAQSYWKETYTDLYDFCYRLDHRCTAVKRYAEGATLDKLDAIQRECARVMNVLKRTPIEGEGEERERELARREDGLVIASKYAGPSSQYSHGLSVYFPWSKPTDDHFWKEIYPKYKFHETTGWGKFLDEYFTKTMRRPHREEAEKDLRQVVRKLTVDEAVLQEVSVRASHEVGQLGKGGGNDWTGKGGGNDWTGDCACPSIKNHPNTTGASPNFFAGAKAS